MSSKKLFQDLKVLKTNSVMKMKPIVLLNSLPEAYKEVKKCTYIWQRLSKTNAIVSALRTRELEI